MLRQGSKPVGCRILDTVLEAEIGKMGFSILKFFNSTVVYEFAITCKESSSPILMLVDTAYSLLFPSKIAE